MELKKEILEEAAKAGTDEVVKALTKLSDQEISGTVANVEIISYQEICDNLHSQPGHSVLAYAQVISGVDGVSFLVMTREAALSFVDLLNKKTVGTTGVLMDIDRSAIKETLNILSNTYLNALSKVAHIGILIGAPYLITASRLESALQKLAEKQEDEVIMLKTTLNIAKHNIEAQLYVIFNQKLVDAIKNIKT